MKLVSQLLLASMLLTALASQPVMAGEVVQANRGTEGQAINAKSLIVSGRPVVVDFYSEFCPPCLKFSPRLERLARKTNIVVMKVNINRPGFKGIDWQSPVALQFGIKTVPYLVLLDPQGKMIAEGQPAMEVIERQMQELASDSQESPAQRAFKTPTAAPAPAPTREADLSPPTIETVRKAKKVQGLNGFIFQDRNSKKFFLEDRDGTTYKFEGGQWAKIGGQDQPVKADDKVQVQEQPPGQAKEADLSAPTIETVRKAKKAQGLNGRIFQDRNSGKWFLEDSDENTYKFDGGQWKKIN